MPVTFCLSFSKKKTIFIEINYDLCNILLRCMEVYKSINAIEWRSMFENVFKILCTASQAYWAEIASFNVSDVKEKEDNLFISSGTLLSSGITHTHTQDVVH